MDNLEKNVSILVIIVSFNGENFISQCIEPLYKAEKNIDILVIDNHSTDNTLKLLENYPDIKLIINNDNFGFGYANNIGFKYALDNNYDYAYLLNQDARINAKDILKLVKIQQKNPEFGIVSPIQVFEGKNKIDLGFNNALTQALRDDYILENPVKKEIYPTINTMQAAHWLISRDVIKKTGGFSPIFFHYGEDNNYCQRVRYKGFKLGIVPSVKGVHDRENRNDSASKRFYIETIRWYSITSDPNLTTKESIEKTIIEIFISAIKHKYKMLKPLVRYLISWRKLMKYKKMSLSDGAFLLNQ